MMLVTPMLAATGEGFDANLLLVLVQGVIILVAIFYSAGPACSNASFLYCQNALKGAFFTLSPCHLLLCCLDYIKYWIVTCFRCFFSGFDHLRI